MDDLPEPVYIQRWCLVTLLTLLRGFAVSRAWLNILQPIDIAGPMPNRLRDVNSEHRL